jgi:hypothetical protein
MSPMNIKVLVTDDLLKLMQGLMTPLEGSISPQCLADGLAYIDQLNKVSNFVCLSNCFTCSLLLLYQMIISDIDLTFSSLLACCLEMVGPSRCLMPLPRLCLVDS